MYQNGLLFPAKKVTWRLTYPNELEMQWLLNWWQSMKQSRYLSNIPWMVLETIHQALSEMRQRVGVLNERQKIIVY